MNYKLYQIHLTDAEVDQVNAEGHNSVPKQKLKLDMNFSDKPEASATEGMAKAWISNIAKREETATAIGTYEALRSVATLLASSLAGLIWYSLGPVWLFGIMAVAALLLALLFAVYVPPPAKPGTA